jgi:hypothetical protein
VPLHHVHHPLRHRRRLHRVRHQRHHRLRAALLEVLVELAEQYVPHQEPGKAFSTVEAVLRERHRQHCHHLRRVHHRHRRLLLRALLLQLRVRPLGPQQGCRYRALPEPQALLRLDRLLRRHHHRLEGRR